MSSIRIAAAAYPIEQLTSWLAFTKKISQWVANAVEQQAQILLFPEYAALELIALLPTELHHNVLEMRPALQEYLPQFLELHQQLAQKHHICIVAGSLPIKYNHNYVIGLWRMEYTRLADH